MKPTFFASAVDFRAWLEANHASADELLVGFYKAHSGKAGMTWPESVDEALAFGWIDGVRKRLDDDAYAIRFTPRKPRSTWSARNVERVRALVEAGRMHPSGMKAFNERAEDRSSVYSYEQKRAPTLDPASEGKLRANPRAWAFFKAQPPWYRRTVSHWVTSAKREATREKRLATLIACSEDGETVPQFTRKKRS